MREFKRLSFSSFCLWLSDPQEFFLRYLASRRPRRARQERPAAAGSAFDACAKSALHSAVFGPGADPRFEFDAIFADQVESHNRDWALEAGRYIFECYKLTGSYDELLALLLEAVSPPRMEFSVYADIECPVGTQATGDRLQATGYSDSQSRDSFPLGDISPERTVSHATAEAGITSAGSAVAEGFLARPANIKIPVLCKPDLQFRLELTDGEPVDIISDWKVKGFCGKSTTSPSKNFRLCRDGYGGTVLGVHATNDFPLGKQSASHNRPHKNYVAQTFRGLEVGQTPFELVSDDYADQLSMYAWSLGQRPGDENTVVAIEEIVASPRKLEVPSPAENESGKASLCDLKPQASSLKPGYPLLRVANHRGRVSSQHQLKLAAQLAHCWTSIQSGHVFADLSRAENDELIDKLELTASSLPSGGSAEDEFYLACSRSAYRG